MPVRARGYISPSNTVVTSVKRIEVFQTECTVISSSQMQCNKRHINGFNTDEGYNDAAQAVDQQVLAQQHSRRLWFVLDAFESQRNQRNDNHSVKDDGRQNGGLGR